MDARCNVRYFRQQDERSEVRVGALWGTEMEGKEAQRVGLTEENKETYLFVLQCLASLIKEAVDD